MRFLLASILVLLLVLSGVCEIFVANQEDSPDTSIVSQQQVRTRQENIQLKSAKDVRFQEYEAAFPLRVGSSAQRTVRQQAFSKNMAKIVRINNRQNGTYKAVVNQFTAIPQEQTRKTYLNLRVPKNATQRQPRLRSSAAPTVQPPPPVSKNWVAEGMVTRVRDQRSCGSCWAFAIVAQVESLQLIARNRTRDLSEKQFIDCNKQQYGCDGGWYDAYQHVVSFGFMNETAYRYPLTNISRQKCRQSPKRVVTQAARFVEQDWNNSCVTLQRALQKGTVSVAVNANDWLDYGYGVFDLDCESSEEVNHAVLAVGWNQTTGVWIIKNSWGSGWGTRATNRGQRGYIQLKGGNCRKVCQWLFYATF